MKKCPFCAEEIQDAAIKCKHCDSVLTASAPSAPQPSTVDQIFKEVDRRAAQGVGLAIKIIGLLTLASIVVSIFITRFIFGQ